MPNTICNANPDHNNPVYMRKGNVLCVAFIDADGKKPVRMLSTALAAQDLRSGRPRLVNSYNRNMGAVDTTDAIMKAYGGTRKNRIQWKKVMLHFFNRIIQNAYILYQKNTTDITVKSRLRFLQEIVEALSGVDRQRVVRVQRRSNLGARSVTNSPGKKEKDCWRSRTICNLFGRGLHKDCVRLHQDCLEKSNLFLYFYF